MGASVFVLVELDMSDYLNTALEAARAGGEVLMSMRKKVVAREKGPRDLVSEADLAAQETIKGILLGRFPEHDFVGEEDAVPSQKSASDYRWIVDPLDGTTNYLHQLQTFAVSIALEHGGELVCGVVFDPVAEECFAAERSRGATLNGTAFRTSDCQTADKALVAASFSPLVDRDSVEIRRFVEALIACQGVRRLGSAALNLCYVAAGRLDGYWATSVKAWDVAAGLLIVREAGGSASHISGGRLDHWSPELVAAASEKLREELVEILQKAEV